MKQDLAFCRHGSGISLLELLIALSVIGILTGIAAPSFKVLILNNTATKIEKMIYQLANSARMTAIYRKQIAVLCPLGAPDYTECGEDWDDGMMIFTDNNNNQEIDDDDLLLEVREEKHSQFEVIWKASAGRNFLRFSPTGMAREFGRFHICYKGDEPIFNRAMVVNRQGRLKRYSERNSEGVVTDVNGNLPDCS